MTNYSKGPWTIDDSGQCMFIYNPDGVVAKLVGAIAWAEDRANAKLIAAAPDLLRLLKQALDNPSGAEFLVFHQEACQIINSVEQ